MESELPWAVDKKLAIIREDEEQEGEDEEQEVGAEEDHYGSFADEFDDVSVVHKDLTRPEKYYMVLNEEDICRHQEEDISMVSTVLSISKEAACMLLRYYNWTVFSVHDEWFADEERVRNAVGILEKPLIKYLSDKEVACGICFENYSCESLQSAGCAHLFCDACWEGYISTSINEGPGCLILRCPSSSCDVAVCRDMIYKLASNEDKKKYHRYLLRSYVEDNSEIKWCPAPGCDSAVKLPRVNRRSYDVTCSCSHSFCWNCIEEAHEPVDCKTVAKWYWKLSAESENMNWILANIRPCPKCKRPIDKDRGCLHMVCPSPCLFEFCWKCLGSWSDHGQRSDPYDCQERTKANIDEVERRRAMANRSLERYTHFYERWSTNHMLMRKSMASLSEMQSEQHEKPSEVWRLDLVTEVLQQIIECRRMLKWTYVYGFNLPEDELRAKKHFFEYSQGEAESGLKKLHQSAGEIWNNYLKSDETSNNFKDFHGKILTRARLMRSYIENLVRDLPGGDNEHN